MAIRDHSECVEKQKAEKYIRKYGSYKQLRLRFIRSGKLKPKSRSRTIYKILKWFGFMSFGEYLNYKFKKEKQDEE